MESAARTMKYRLSDVTWRYEMLSGKLVISLAGGELAVQIDPELQIDHSPINIYIEVPIYDNRK